MAGFSGNPAETDDSKERVGQRKLQFGSEVLNLGEFLEPLSSSLKETLGSVIPETPSVSSNLVSLHRLAPIGVGPPRVCLWCLRPSVRFPDFHRRFRRREAKLG